MSVEALTSRSVAFVRRRGPARSSGISRRHRVQSAVSMAAIPASDIASLDGVEWTAGRSEEMKSTMHLTKYLEVYPCSALVELPSSTKSRPPAWHSYSCPYYGDSRSAPTIISPTSSTEACIIHIFQDQAEMSKCIAMAWLCPFVILSRRCVTQSSSAASHMHPLSRSISTDEVSCFFSQALRQTECSDTPSIAPEL